MSRMVKIIAVGFVLLIAIVMIVLIVTRKPQQQQQTTEQPTGPTQEVQKTDFQDPNQERKDFLTLSAAGQTLYYYRPAGFGLFSLSASGGTETKLTNKPISLVQNLRWSTSLNKVVFQATNQKEFLQNSVPDLLRSDLADEALTWWEYDLNTDQLVNLPDSTTGVIFAGDQLIILQQGSGQFSITNHSTGELIFSSNAIGVTTLLAATTDGSTVYGLFSTDGSSFLGSLDAKTKKVKKLLENISLPVVLSPNFERALVQVPLSEEEVSLWFYDLSEKIQKELGITQSIDQLDKIAWSTDSQTIYIARPNTDESKEGDELLEFAVTNLTAPQEISTGVDVAFNYLTLDEANGYIFFVASDRIYRVPLNQ